MYEIKNIKDYQSRFGNNDDLSPKQLIIKSEKISRKIEELEEEYRTVPSDQKSDIEYDQKLLEDELEYIEYLISLNSPKKSR